MTRLAVPAAPDDDLRPDEVRTESEEVAVRPQISLLGALCASWEDVQRTRMALMQRDLVEVAEALKPIEAKLGRDVKRELGKSVIWPWLSQFPGLGGVHTARLIAIIGSPLRFPGRPCTKGHISPALPEGHRESGVPLGEGGPCPVVTADGEPCDGTMLPNRRGTGVASLWHYCGLHAVNGRSPSKRRGQVADWNPRARTCVLMPGGIAEQIVRQRVPVYRDLYDATKERLIRERGADNVAVTATWTGPALTDGPEADRECATDTRLGLRPIQIDNIARKVAAKAFVGDLLTEWKRLLSAEDLRESDPPLDREENAS